MDTLNFIDPPAHILAPDAAAVQPPLLEDEGVEGKPLRQFAAIASLALGGAERIVLDWAARAASRHRVCIAVLHDAVPEWPVPPGVQVLRFHGNDIVANLVKFGAQAALERKAGGKPVICCHLLTANQRQALRSGGSLTVLALHNAAIGWLEPVLKTVEDVFTISVSEAAAREYRAAGGRAPNAVVRHFPHKPLVCHEARAGWRARWAIPPDAWVIGMVGAVKPQKAYTRALRVLREILDNGAARLPPYLVIVGGPTGRDGTLAWNAMLAKALQLGVTEHLRLPGYVAQGSQCLPAFDVFLNTSRYEGLSIGTLEALASGLPVVASRVGGQGEVSSPGLTLLAFDAPDEQWSRALLACERHAPQSPFWVGFPGERQWTLAYLACGFNPQPRKRARALFITANLNAGGAQRSLVNLALALGGRLDFEIAVAGDSSTAVFAQKLTAAGVRHFRSARTRECFDHAEALISHIVRTEPTCVCFWNLDAKIKLLLVKWLGHASLRFIDVSPGDYLFDEMHAARDFQQCIAFSETEYFRRIDRLVHKYHVAPRLGLEGKVSVIANGVPVPAAIRTQFSFAESKPARIALCGRIAPSKFVIEAIEAIRLLCQIHAGVELHIFGVVEERHRDYAMRIAHAAGVATSEGARIVFHGAAFDAPEQLAQYDALLVLGQNQGCPNSVLEGLAAGVPVVANDSGGTSELVIHGKTGLLLDAIHAATIAAALRRVVEDPELARKLSVGGKKHVTKQFSMNGMRDRYLRLLR